MIRSPDPPTPSGKLTATNSANAPKRQASSPADSGKKTYPRPGPNPGGTLLSPPIGSRGDQGPSQSRRVGGGGHWVPPCRQRHRWRTPRHPESRPSRANSAPSPSLASVTDRRHHWLRHPRYLPFRHRSLVLLFFLTMLTLRKVLLARLEEGLRGLALLIPKPQATECLRGPNDLRSQSPPGTFPSTKPLF